MKSIQYALALTAAFTVAGFALASTPAVAANSAMADCNKQWNDAKTANKTNGGTYQDFLKGCLKTSAAATTAPATKAKTDTTVKTTAAPATTTTTAAAADTAASDPMAKEKKACNKEWKAAKDGGTAGTQKKKEFVAACLAKMAPGADKPKAPAAAATVAPAVVAPAKAADTTAKAADTTAKPADTMANDAAPAEPAADVKTKPIATVDVNGKPRTAGQLAMDKRIKECGGMWQQAKKDNTTGGLKWPQYWSQCNKKLKAAGN